MPVIYFIAMIAMLGFGINVLWNNGARTVNLVFASVCFVCALYFAFTLVARYHAHRYYIDHTYGGVPWIRLAWTMTGLMPLYLWTLFHIVLGRYRTRKELLLNLAPWAAVSLGLCVLVWTQFFVRDGNLPDRRTPGPGFLGFQVVLVVSAGALLARSLLLAPRLKGIRKIEFQYLTINCAALSVFAVLLPMITALPVELRKLVTIPIVCYGVSGWAIASRRVYHSREVYLSLAAYTLLIGCVGFGSLWTISATSDMEGNLYARVAIVGLFTLAGYGGHRVLRRWLRIGSEQSLADLRRLTIDLARTEPHPDKLVTQLEALLREKCQTRFVALLFSTKSGHASTDLTFAKDRPAHAALCEAGWATPETLQRQRSNGGIEDLKRFLAQHSLGLLVAAPLGSQTPSLIVALGIKTDEWPYTYREVERLQNIAELMDNILSHSRLTTEAALKAKTEHLAMMSRGLAHDLKNLLTPVSSFLVHMEGRLPADSDEAEVHAAARRSVRIMSDYVREARFFADRLAPRFERTNLRHIFHSVREATSARASTRGVAVVSTLENDGELVLDAVLIQRLVVNLVSNAIDASLPGSQVVMHGRRDGGRVRVRVVDAGCGISAENLGSIFEPYFTTKEFGDDVRGFGLGLTICQKIAALHDGSITVHSEVGKGTTFTVDLPGHPAALFNKPHGDNFSLSPQRSK